MKLAYEAFDKTGQKVSDVIEASDIAEATEDLRKQDLFVADITPVRGGGPVRVRSAAVAVAPRRPGRLRLKASLRARRVLAAARVAG